MKLTTRAKALALIATLILVPTAIGLAQAATLTQTTVQIPAAPGRADAHLSRVQDRLGTAHRHEQWYRHKVVALHVRIDDLRDQLSTPSPLETTSSSESSSSSSSGSYSNTSNGPLRISEAEAAAAMRAAGFPESAIAWFNGGIIARESGYCPTAVYPGHCGDISLMIPGGNACSLFQLYHCPGPQAADPYVAARYAFAKYQDSGYGPWGG